MVSTIASLSNYIFLFLISIFLLTGFLICLGEKNIIKINIKRQTTLQRIVIFIFHSFAFLILAINKDDNTESSTIFLYFILSLLFLVFANLIAKFIYRRSCSLIWNGIFFFMSIGSIMLYRLNPYLAEKQLVWFVLGFAVCLIIPLILSILPRLDFFKYLYLFLGLSLLLATLSMGIENGGAKNWISIYGFSFQPSEVVKILFIFYLASCFAKPNIKFINLIFPTIMTMVFLACLVFQTDLGSALIFFMTYLSMVFIATSKFWIVSLSSILGAIATFIAYNVFSHVKVRFDIWLNPWLDAGGKGYQIVQSLFAITSFGLMGSGLNNGMPKKIPVVEKDMIFAAICEEFGVLFGIGLILVFVMIFYRCVRIALDTQNRFLSLLVSGLSSLVCFQAFLIIGGSIKLIPLTGVTLPFISYGGSSILISFVLIGILQWVAIKNEKYVEKQNELLNEESEEDFVQEDFDQTSD